MTVCLCVHDHIDINMSIKDNMLRLLYLLLFITATILIFLTIIFFMLVPSIVCHSPFLYMIMRSAFRSYLSFGIPLYLESDTTACLPSGQRNVLL